MRSSALEKQGIDKIWEAVNNFRESLKNSGEWEQQRRVQSEKWMWTLVEEGLLNNFHKNEIIKKSIPEMDKSVASGEIMPANAAKKLLEKWESSKK